MAHQESALYEPAERLSGTDGGLAASLADILAAALQELIEAEATDRIGAEPGQRTPSRVAQRNGHRPKRLATPAGEVEVGIPKLREGSFFPELLEPRRRIDKALWAVIMTAYVTGTSTRKVDDLVRALGCSSGVSKSTVSRICKGIDDDVAVLRTRRLDHQPFVYVWLDATYVHVREHGQVVSKAVVIATGLRADGHREVLGVDVGDSENETFWAEFLRGLKDRGLAGVRLVVSDAHAGLKAAIRKVLQGSGWQRCRVHAMRNLQYGRADRADDLYRAGAAAQLHPGAQADARLNRTRAGVPSWVHRISARCTSLAAVSGEFTVPAPQLPRAP